MSEYDHGYPIPTWFLDQVRKAVTTGGWKRPDLLKRINELHSERESPWDGTAITKFLNGGRRTIELANALAAAIGISSPVVVLDTVEEANEVDRVMKRIRPAPKTSKTTKR